MGRAVWPRHRFHGRARRRLAAQLAVAPLEASGRPLPRARSSWVAAEELASHGDWPGLYDRDALARNEVPCAAALYHDDMYVDRSFSLDTAEAISGLKLWVTNEFEHNGLRTHGDRVFGRLHAMLGGRA